MPLRRAGLALAWAPLVLAACGGGATATPSPTATAALTLAPRTPAAVASAVAMVEPAGRPAQEWSFQPAELRVATGTKVTWTNTGAEFHTVTSDDAGKTFDSHVVNPKETFTLTFSTAGTFPYHCDFHPWMKGVVRVCDGGCP